MTASPPHDRDAGVVAHARAAWTAWVALWDRREPATALALVRVLVGACLVADLAPLWRLGLVDALYGAAGYGTAADHGTEAGRAPDAGVVVDLLGADPGPVLYAIALACAVGLLIGAATRVSAVGYALAAAQLAALAPDADRGIHQLLRVVALILALSGSHARWSVDAWVWRRLGRPLPRDIPAWPRYLLLAQLVWVYWSGGVNKAGAEWGPHGGFTALENILTNPQWARLPIGWIAPVTPLARLATALTMLFELGAPAYLLAYYLADTPPRGPDPRPGRLRRVITALRVRAVWIALGLCFQVEIAVTLRLGVFPYGMLALYPVLLRPAEIAQAGAWLRARVSRPA